MFAGISAADAVSPQTVPPAANSKKRKAMQASGSDGTDLNDQHDLDSESDVDLDMLMQDSDSASDQNSEQDLELESELDSDLSQEMMEDRQTGMPAETSGRDAVTAGERAQPTATPCLVLHTLGKPGIPACCNMHLIPPVSACHVQASGLSHQACKRVEACSTCASLLIVALSFWHSLQLALDWTEGVSWHAVEASSEKYIPPAARAAAQVAVGGLSQLQRRVRGLLNRMSDSNLPAIVADVLQLAEQEGERAIADAVTAELLQVRHVL